MILKIGEMLRILRERAGIPQKDLARGIFTLAEYSRVERGERETDKAHLEALFQRLGKSEDKLELAVPIKEYKQQFFHHIILQLLAVEDIKGAEMAISEYAHYLDLEKPLHCQSLILLQTVKEYIENKNKQAVIKKMEEAIEITFPDWRQVSYDNIYLCRQELQLLLLIAYFNVQVQKQYCTEQMKDDKDVVNAEALLKKLLNYINEKYTDEQEKVKILPQCLWLLGLVYWRQKNIGKALGCCKKGIENLAISGSLMPMRNLLVLQIECLKIMEEAEEIQDSLCKIEAIDFLYQIAGVNYPIDEMIVLLLPSMQGEITVTNELLKELREAKGISQEELCEGICTRETLSRIEGGKRSPNRKKLFAMLKRMGVERETYYGYIAADEYQLYENVNVYFMCEGKSQKEIADAEIAFQELERCLNRKYLINRQFLETEWAKRKIKKDKDDWEKCFETLKEILSYSMREYKGEIYRVPFRQEVIILVYMAICLRRLDRKDEALEIYRQIMERYEKSMIAKPFHATPLFLIYANYVGLLEVTNHLEDSEQVAKEGLNFALECRRGDVAAEILANLSCVYEKTQNKELAELCLRHSFYLLDLYKYEDECKVLKTVYENTYTTVLN